MKKGEARNNGYKEIRRNIYCRKEKQETEETRKSEETYRQEKQETE